MRKLNVKLYCSYIWIGVLYCLTIPGLHGQEEYSKSIDQSFANIEYLKVNHLNGDLIVRPSKDNQCHIMVKLSLVTNNEADANAVFNHYELESDENGNRLHLKSSFLTNEVNTVNGKTKITFKDGQTVRQIRDFSIEMILEIPPMEVLALANKYGSIQFQTTTLQNLSVELYDGELHAGNIEGQLDLQMKYSKGYLGNFGSANIDSYDSRIKAGNGGNLNLQSKYSEIECLNLGNLQLETYDDRFKLGNVGNFSVTDKYSELSIQNFGTGRMDIYDTNIFMNSGANLTFKSKYSSIDINNIVSFDFELSYDDEININQVESVIGTSKYSNFKIEHLGRKLVLNSYQDELTIKNVVGPLDEITFTGQYTDLDIKLPENMAYRLFANLKYGDLDFPKSRFKTDKYIEKDSAFELEGATNDATINSPLVKINAYDGEIKIR